MKHFAFVLYVGFDAQKNLCDKQIVLFYGTFEVNYGLRYIKRMLNHSELQLSDKQHNPRMSDK